MVAGEAFPLVCVDLCAGLQQFERGIDLLSGSWRLVSVAIADADETTKTDQKKSCFHDKTLESLIRRSCHRLTRSRRRGFLEMLLAFGYGLNAGNGAVFASTIS